MSGRRDPYAEVGAATRVAIARAMQGLTLPEARVLLALVGRLTSWSILGEPIAAAQLATDTGMDERAVRRAVASLAQRHAIERAVSSGYRASTYRLPTPPDPGLIDPGPYDQGSTAPGFSRPPNPGQVDQGNPGQVDHHPEDYARTSPEDSLSRAPRALTKATANDESAFTAFWSAWPKKVKKPDARKAWKAATKKAGADTIVDAARRHAAGYAADGRDRRFIPNPATWLRDEQWNDDPPSPKANGNGSRDWTGGKTADQLAAEAVARLQRTMGMGS